MRLVIEQEEPDGFGYFFSEDIRNALLAANEASAATAAMVADLRLEAGVIANLRAYREGYAAALATVALAFGISPAFLLSSGKQQARQVVQSVPLLKGNKDE